MREPWAEVPCGIDGVACRSAKRQPDSPDQRGYEVGSQSRSGPGRCYGLRKDCPDDEDKNESSDNLADQVCAKTPDRGGSAETSQLQRLVRCFLPMGKKMEPHESSSDERAGHLSEKKRYEVREMTRRYREPDRNGRIEMSF